MLKRLRFKNWRSLKDVVIEDLTPITVFIGANSSGKTNIVKGLSFLQQAMKEQTRQSLLDDIEIQRMRTIGIHEPMELALDFQPVPYPSDHLQPDQNDTPLTFDFHLSPSLRRYILSMDVDAGKFKEALLDLSTGQHLLKGEDGEGYYPFSGGRLSSAGLLLPLAGGFMGRHNTRQPDPDYALFSMITSRLQILGENFTPDLIVSNETRGDKYSIESNAKNMLLILNFIQRQFPSIYQRLQDDLTWLLHHVDELRISNDEFKARLVVREKSAAQEDAPTISAGTNRIVAMLTAYYALEMRESSMPGLVVIEEPDTALNPGLLGRFVELLRTYTERQDAPRQFILTTHNPTLLDYFQPEEVRVVERDEAGYTHVKRIPDSVKEIWLDEYGLGEVWTTNSFGGLPE